MNARDWCEAWRRTVAMTRRIAGIPDYDAYVAHLRSHHPERPVPSRAEFIADRQAARYRGGGRGCC